MTKTDVFAAYLPQYHETEDNNKFWGKGFTDWVGVKNAKPQYDGHRQPRVPINNDYYNLLDKNVIKRQAELAREHGITGFNIYHYWFKNGKQELERPAEILLENSDIEISYFFTWDNGAWKRTWGNVKGNDWAPEFDKNVQCKSGEAILVPFEYGDISQWREHFEYLLPFFKDRRYYKIDNKPVFMFIGRDDLDILEQMGKNWSEWAKEEGFAGMYMATKKKNFADKPVFDAVFAYEPETSAWGKRRAIDKRLNSLLKIKTKRDEPVRYRYSYDKVWKRILKSVRKSKENEIVGSFVRYDDTPRRGREAMVVENESADKFKQYFSELYRICCMKNVKILLVTAWNEWGEGAYLEEDTEDKDSYLKALKDAVSSV